MAVAPELVEQRLIPLLQRPATPFIEDLRIRSWPHLIEVRHEYPIYVGKVKERLGREVWKQYIKDFHSQLGDYGRQIGGWTGTEVEAYRAFTYEIDRDGQAGVVLEDQFIKDRRAARDLDLPLSVVDQMFERPSRGIPRVEYVDTVAGRVIKQIHFD